VTLRGSIVARSELAARDIVTMHALMTRHYDGLDARKFRGDLDEKDGAILIRDAGGEIHGFSTYRVLRGEGPAGRYRVLFSGDTIVDARSWGSTVTLRTFGRLLESLLESAGPPFHWLLLSKGIRTYLLLPLLFERFYPGGGVAGGEPERGVLEQVCAARYGAAYHRAESIVRPVGGADRLKPEWARIDPARLANAHVRFFLERNPGFVRGDELASIAAIRFANLTAAGRRLVGGPVGATADAPREQVS
jgi:hypothetical protein